MTRHLRFALAVTLAACSVPLLSQSQSSGADDPHRTLARAGSRPDVAHDVLLPLDVPVPQDRVDALPLRVLIVYADSTGQPAVLRSQIQAQPGVIGVDLFDGIAGTPSLAQLQGYGIVVPLSNSPFVDATTLGNNLADYVDGGGVVVQFGFSFYGPGQPYGVNGRWLTGNYNPFNYSTNLLFTAFTLGTFSAAHPLMAGVSTLNSNFQNVVTLAAGATQVAAASNGNPLVAFRPVGGHTTVGVTAYVGAEATQSGDWGKVVVNAGNWLGASSGCGGFQAKLAAPVDAYGRAISTDGVYIYAAGGYSFSAGDTITTFSRYNPAANSWAALAPIPTSVSLAAGVYSPINNKFYVFGGASGSANSTIRNLTQVYDVATNSWSAGATMPAVRSQMASGYHNGKIYLVGGHDTSGVTPQATTWEYDPVANSWNTSRLNIPHAVGGAGSGVIAGHLYVAGGRDVSVPNLDLVYDYNIAANSWTPRQSMPAGANVPGSGVVNGQLWLMGGGSPFGPATTAATMVYEPSTNTWTSGPSLTQVRSFTSATGFDGKLFVTGGYNGATTVTTTEMAGCGRPFGDVDIDRKTDRTIYRNGAWFTAKTGGGATTTVWGTASDVDVFGDYDGDRIADVAVWRPSSGTWFIVQSNNGIVRTDPWGQSGDIPMAGDADGDGKADLIIFRPSAGAWFAKLSSGASPIIFGWGLSTDYPLVGDYDGDGRTDFVAYRPSAGVWYIVLAGGGTRVVGWGVPGDIPVAGNYDGDARYDPAIFRPGTGQWFVNGSLAGTIIVGWGINGDIPVSGDWDGDGRSDFTVWRDANGAWYTQYAIGGFTTAVWGVSGDKPSGRRPGT